MELTFVHQYAGGTPKRRRLAKACDSCRARKKRCVHVAGADTSHTLFNEDDRSDDVPRSTGDASASNPVDESPATETGANDSTSNGTATERSRPHSAGSRRFFSDLNPEATFLNRQRLSGDKHSKPLNADIGVWVDKAEWEALVQHQNGTSGRYPQATKKSVLASKSIGQRLHPTVIKPLVDVYFRKIHPILPLLDETEFRQHFDAGDVPEPLVYALCIVAAKDAEAEPHRRLEPSSSVLQPRQFCSRVYECVTSSLKADSNYDKVTLIRILALVSLHNEGAEGSEEGPLYLTQAMYHAQTLGLHLGQHSSTPTGPDLSLKRLFWSLWALDRASSCMRGRPIIMADIDIAIETFAPGESGFPAFEAWLKVTEVLNKVISFYRPHKNGEAVVSGWEDVFPGLEEIFDDADAWQQPRSVLATIHLYYLAVAMLSHRSRGIKQIVRSTGSSLRQRLCAIEVIRLLESDYCRNLHNLPFIPYTLSLALSVSYQHLRQSQLHHQQEDARNDFRRCTKLLQNLCRTWSSADTMAALAKKVLNELDKAPSLASFRIKRNAGGGERVPPCMPTLEGERTGLLEAVAVANEASAEHNVGTQADLLRTTGEQLVPYEGTDLDGIDDIFGTYMDPNYPLNFEDLSFMDEMPPIDWSYLDGQPP